MFDYEFPARAPQDAIDWFSSKKIKPSFDYRDVYREEHAYAFVIAKLAEMDILQNVRDEFIETLRGGKTVQQFKKELTPTLKKLGWWGKQERIDPVTKKTRVVQLGSPSRLRRIYDTNMSTSRAAGQWARISRTRKTHPYLLYELGPSKERRKEHVQWAGIILPATDPFWQTHYPPNGWGCKCRVRQITQREYERLNNTGKYLTEAPDVERREWVNKRSGEVFTVPEGIDPGFDSNPGTARQEYMQKLVTTKLNSSHSSIAIATAKELVYGPGFSFFLNNPLGKHPVGVLDEELKQPLNAKFNSVMLSSDTLAQQRDRHPELNEEDYRLLPDVITHGAVIQQGKSHLVYLRNNDQLYKAVLKMNSKDEVHITSFHHSEDAELNRDHQRGKVVRDNAEVLLSN